jgi:hypothetical protein
MNDVTTQTDKRKPILQWTLLGVAVIMTVTGLLDNGFSDVLIKAVMICMECIGIG